MEASRLWPVLGSWFSAATPSGSAWRRQSTACARLLKCLLRAYGFRVLSIREAEAPEAVREEMEEPGAAPS
jgi:hypothetical protein